MEAAERVGLAISDLSVSEPTLENVFIALTGKDLRDCTLLLSLSDRVPHMPALVIVVVMVVATAGLVKLGVDGFKRRVLT